MIFAAIDFISFSFFDAAATFSFILRAFRFFMPRFDAECRIAAAAIDFAAALSLILFFMLHADLMPFDAMPGAC